MHNDDLRFTQLTDFAEGRLNAAQSAQVQAQLAADPQLAADLAWIRATLDLMRSDLREDADAPEHVINRALRLVRAPAPAPHPLRQLIARLRSDSRQAPLAFGMRSGSARQRHLLYSTATLDIDLRVSLFGESLQINGQILGYEGAGTVQLSSAAQSHHADLNDLAEFVLKAIPPGRYTLTVTLPDQATIIAELDLAEEPRSGS